MKTTLISTIFLSVFIGLVSCTRVEQVQPEKTDIIEAVFATGQVIYEQEYKVTANTEGYLMQVFVEEGSTVLSGKQLYQISNDISAEQVSNAQINYQNAVAKLDPNSPEFIQARLQVEQAKSQLFADEKNLHRYKELLESGAVSSLDFEKIELQYENSKRNLNIQEQGLKDLKASLELNVANAKTQLRINQESNTDYFLSSKIDGVVLQNLKQSGDLVRRGEVLAIIGGGQMLSKLYIAEEEINDIELNQEVIINLNTEKERSYRSYVSKIFPSFDEVEQSFIIEARFDEKPHVLYHNTQLQANIIINNTEDALVIPSDYLSNGDSVSLKSKEMRFVEVGIRNEKWVEVKTGLDAKDVLIKPNQL